MVAHELPPEVAAVLAGQLKPRAIADDHTRRMIAMASLLSLDVVAPFYGSMGVVLAEPGEFRRSLREIMVRGRQQFRQTQILVDVPSELRRVITEREGEPRAAEFQRWWDHLYFDSPAQQRQWSWWSEAFERGLATGPRAAESPILDEKHARLVTMYRELMDFAELEIQAKALKAAPLSDWDLEIYVRRGFDHDDFMMDDPFKSVFPIVRVARLQLFARSLCAALAPDEQRRIQERASRLIAAFEPIEPLAPLAELPIGHMSPL